MSDFDDHHVRYLPNKKKNHVHVSVSRIHRIWLNHKIDALLLGTQTFKIILAVVRFTYMLGDVFHRSCPPPTVHDNTVATSLKQ